MNPLDNFNFSINSNKEKLELGEEQVNALQKLEEFVSKHELKLEYKYQEDLNKPEGTIIKQSRAKDSVVTPGATLVITVTTKPEESTDDGVVVEE